MVGAGGRTGGDGQAPDVRDGGAGGAVPPGRRGPSRGGGRCPGRRAGGGTPQRCTSPRARGRPSAGPASLTGARFRGKRTAGRSRSEDPGWNRWPPSGPRARRFTAGPAKPASTPRPLTSGKGEVRLECQSVTEGPPPLGAPRCHPRRPGGSEAARGSRRPHRSPRNCATRSTGSARRWSPPWASAAVRPTPRWWSHRTGRTSSRPTCAWGRRHPPARPGRDLRGAGDGAGPGGTGTRLLRRRTQRVAGRSGLGDLVRSEHRPGQAPRGGRAGRGTCGGRGVAVDVLLGEGSDLRELTSSHDRVASVRAVAPDPATAVLRARHAASLLTVVAELATTPAQGSLV